MIALLALPGAASATFVRVADEGAAGLNTSRCFGPNCYFSGVGTSDNDLQTADQLEAYYLDGFARLTTSFEPERIHTAFDGASFSLDPCGPDCTWATQYGAGNLSGYRRTTFDVSDPTPVRLYGSQMPGDLLVLDGSSGSIVFTYEPNFDETVTLGPGRYVLEALMPVCTDCAISFAGGERITLEIVPEPATALLLMLGLLGLAARRRESTVTMRWLSMDSWHVQPFGGSASRSIE